VWERGGSDVAVLDGSGTVVSQGFDWYMNQLETRTGRRRTEEDRAEATAAPEKFWEAEKKKKKNRGDSEPVLWYHVERKVLYWITCKLYMRGLYI